MVATGWSCCNGGWWSRIIDGFKKIIIMTRRETRILFIAYHPGITP
jgi:hypothetical protein